MSENDLATILVGHPARLFAQASLLALKAKAAGIVLCLLALAGLVACGPLPSKAHAATPAIPRCASLLAQSQIAGHSARGAFACLTPEAQALAGLSSDQEIADAAAQPPVYTSYRYVGHTANGYYFEYRGASAEKGCFRFHVDTQGLIDRFGYRNSDCPKPLL